MKWFVKTILFLMAFAMALTGCGSEQISEPTTKDPTQMPVEDPETPIVNNPSQNEYQILKFDFSDSIAGASHNIEYNGWNTESSEVAGVPQSISTSFGGMEITGTYVSTSRSEPNNYSTHTYRSELGSFDVDENGRITFIYLSDRDINNGSNSNELVTQDECEKLAVDYLSAFVDIEEYQIEAEYIEEWQQYRFTFTKYIGSQRTADEAIIYVTNTGKLAIFRSTMLGRIPSDTEINFDYAEVEKEVYSKLDESYADVKPYCDKIIYETKGHYLTILETGELALIYTVEVNCVYDVYEYEMAVGELVSFVVLKTASGEENTVA